MKILHILDHSIPLHSGYTFRTREILKNQQSLGLETYHITSPKQGNNNACKETVDDLIFYRTEPPTGFISKLPFFNQLTIIPKLKDRILNVSEEVKPDIIHAHSPALNGLAAILAGKKANIPVVYEIRAFWEDAAVDHGNCKEGDLRYKLTRAMETYVVKKAHAITTICDGLKQDLIKRGIKEEKITLIPNAVNLKNFALITEKSSQILERYHLKNSFVIGFVGSFYHYEGIDILIKALAVIKKTGLDIKVLLVGGGSQQSKIVNLIETLNLQDRVILTGRVPHHEVKDYYSVMNVTALPRKSMRLTELVTPLKPLEAMALGIPVLASDIGGHRELIKHNINGYLFEADNEQALADMIISLFNDHSSFAKIVKNGRDFVENIRNWKVSVSNYPAVYQYAQRHLLNEK